MAPRITLLTPAARGAVAAIAVEGSGALALVARQFRANHGRPLEAQPPHRLVLGRWQSGAGQGEEVVVWHDGPQVVRIHSHGGRLVSDALIASLVEIGGEPQAPEQWIGAGTGAGIAADAWQALMHARTTRCCGILLDQYRGALGRAMDRMVEQLVHNRLDAALAQLDALRRLYPLGLHLTQPWIVTIAGRPNVGKSSLINAILGYERCIVFDQEGTTRDVVTASTALDGWPVDLADTAGWRTSRDAIEAEGMARAQQKLERSDLIVMVHDAREILDGRATFQLPDTVQCPRLVVYNKVDLMDPSRPLGADTDSAIFTSAVTGRGVEDLIDRISSALVPDPPRPGTGVPFTSAQIDALELARTALLAADTTTARRELTRLARPEQ